MKCSNAYRFYQKASKKEGYLEVLPPVRFINYFQAHFGPNVGPVNNFDNSRCKPSNEPEQLKKSSFRGVDFNSTGSNLLRDFECPPVSKKRRKKNNLIT